MNIAPDFHSYVSILLITIRHFNEPVRCRSYALMSLMYLNTIEEADQKAFMVSVILETLRESFSKKLGSKNVEYWNKARVLQAMLVISPLITAQVQIFKILSFI